MKYLSLIVMFALLQISLPVPRKTGKAPAKTDRSVQKNLAGQQQPSSLPVSVGNPEHAKTDKQSSEGQSNPNEHITVLVAQPTVVSRWEKAYVILTALLVIVGAVGTCYAIKTLKAVERQAKANEGQLTEIQQSGEKTDRMILIAAQEAENAKIATDAAKKSADAAFLHAEAIVNSERPWLFIKADANRTNPIEKAKLSFTAFNHGRTPAEITVSVGDFMYDDPDKLPNEPEYPLSGVELAHKRYVVPGGNYEIYSFDCELVLDDNSLEMIKRRETRLVFYGHVIYRDLITQKEHESRYCYWLSPISGIGLVIGGGPEWNKHT